MSPLWTKQSSVELLLHGQLQTIHDTGDTGSSTVVDWHPVCHSLKYQNCWTEKWCEHV